MKYDATAEVRFFELWHANISTAESIELRDGPRRFTLADALRRGEMSAREAFRIVQQLRLRRADRHH